MMLVLTSLVIRTVNLDTGQGIRKVRYLTCTDSLTLLAYVIFAFLKVVVHVYRTENVQR